MTEEEFNIGDLGETATVPEGFVQDPDIADIEHFLKGSGVVVKDKIVNGDTLASHFEHHGIPSGLFKFKEIDEDLNERRSGKKELQGVWTPFDMDKIDFDVIMRWSPTVGLNPVNSSREIPSEWEIWFTNTTEKGKGEVITDPNEIIAKLPIRPGFEDIFSLQKAEKSLQNGSKTPFTKLVVNPSRIVGSPKS